MRFNHNTGPLANTPTVVKNLVIINAIMLAVKWMGKGQFLGFDMDQALGLHYIGTPDFRPWQFVTYMFMHAGLFHLLGNMFGLFFLGAPLEYRWGSKRFLQFYVICGIGAAVINMGIQSIDYHRVLGMLSPDQMQAINANGREVWETLQRGYGRSFSDPNMNDMVGLMYSGMRGASGAVFGVITAFAMLYPNVELFLYFIPVPIKAKYLAIGYGSIELYLGFAGRFGWPGGGGDVAHFAHIGGLVVGFITVMIWKRRLPYT
ncbi:MAG TPA: rhomboid family intramembrane serine protease [Flavobacteriales bacterium]|nr:rhomboid family intramembrane serine protease [Flavobacteriales bacterium]